MWTQNPFFWCRASITFFSREWESLRRKVPASSLFPPKFSQFRICRGATTLSHLKLTITVIQPFRIVDMWVGEGVAKAVDTMERMRKMLGVPRLKVPTYAQLWDGTWWAKVVKSIKILIFIHSLCPEGWGRRRSVLGGWVWDATGSGSRGGSLVKVLKIKWSYI